MHAELALSTRETEFIRWHDSYAGNNEIGGYGRLRLYQKPNSNVLFGTVSDLQVIKQENSPTRVAIDPLAGMKYYDDQFGRDWQDSKRMPNIVSWHTHPGMSSRPSCQDEDEVIDTLLRTTSALLVLIFGAQGLSGKLCWKHPDVDHVNDERIRYDAMDTFSNNLILRQYPNYDMTRDEEIARAQHVEDSTSAQYGRSVAVSRVVLRDGEFIQIPSPNRVLDHYGDVPVLCQGCRGVAIYDLMADKCGLCGSDV